MRKLLLILALYTGYCKAQSTIDALMKKIQLEKYSGVDIGQADTLIDGDKKYFEISTSPKNKVLQSMVFKNADSSFTLVVTGLFADEQCSFHKSFCFTTVHGTDSLKSIQALPEITVKDLLKGSKAPQAIRHYLPAIKKAYLDKNATLDDLMEEIYSVCYTIDPGTGDLQASLDVCDYIPVNQVSIEDRHWIVVTQDFLKLRLCYNPEKKVFVKMGKW